MKIIACGSRAAHKRSWHYIYYVYAELIRIQRTFRFMKMVRVVCKYGGGQVMVFYVNGRRLAVEGVLFKLLSY